MAVKRPDGTWLVAKTANGDWHPEDIKAAVRKTLDGDGKAWSLERLAVSSGLPSHACRASKKGDAAGEAAIAKLLGLVPRDIWPSRYGRDGTRINPALRSTEIINAQLAARHCENRGAA